MFLPAGRTGNKGSSLSPMRHWLCAFDTLSVDPLNDAHGKDARGIIGQIIEFPFSSGLTNERISSTTLTNMTELKTLKLYLILLEAFMFVINVSGFTRKKLPVKYTVSRKKKERGRKESFFF